SAGFQATFSRPLTTTVLNGFTSGILGAADVTLTGAVAGSINGTLLLDQGNTRITFIQSRQTGVGAAPTYGILSHETYTPTPARPAATPTPTRTPITPCSTATPTIHPATVTSHPSPSIIRPIPSRSLCPTSPAAPTRMWTYRQTHQATAFRSAYQTTPPRP